MINMDGLGFLLDVGLGAVVGAVLVLPVVVAGFFIPEFWDWLWVPFSVGTLGGAVYGIILEKSG